MIYGIGTDLINSERVEKLLNKFGEKFLFKIFSNEEIIIQKTLTTKLFIFLKDLLVKKRFGKLYHLIKKIHYTLMKLKFYLTKMESHMLI